MRFVKGLGKSWNEARGAGDNEELLNHSLGVWL
jgi:hypothetical protein